MTNRRLARRAVPALAVLLLLSGCAGEEPAPAQTPPEPAAPFTAAVVRADGYLVPFATYEEGAWAGPASVAGGGTLEADGAAREPAWFADRLDSLRTWRVTTPLETGDAVRDPGSATTPGTPADVRSYCQSAWMLQSALPATPVGETQMAARILGVAFSRDVDVVPAAVLTPNEAEYASALAAIETDFDTAEAAEIARREADGQYDGRTAGRDAAKAPLAITSLHRVGGDAGASLYLFEARRTYNAPPGSGPADCDQATIMTGWLAENAAGELTLIPGTPGVSMTNCDRKGAAVVEPLGAVVADGRTFVVVVNHGYEGESYSIHDVSPAEAREAVTVYGGGC